MAGGWTGCCRHKHQATMDQQKKKAQDSHSIASSFGIASLSTQDIARRRSPPGFRSDSEGSGCNWPKAAAVPIVNQAVLRYRQNRLFKPRPEPTCQATVLRTGVRKGGRRCERAGDEQGARQALGVQEILGPRQSAVCLKDARVAFRIHLNKQKTMPKPGGSRASAIYSQIVKAEGCHLSQAGGRA